MGMQISNFENYFTTRGNQHELNLRNNLDLYPPFARTESGKTTVQHSGSVLWNQISEEIRSSKTSSIFKNKLFKSMTALYID